MTQGKKKSTFITQDSVPDNHFIDTFGNGVNRKIPKTKFFEQIRKNQQTFIYENIVDLQAANLEADPDDPVYVRVAETGFWLYQITSLAATGLDISLDNGTTATRIYEETAVIPLPDITSLSSLNTAALVDGQSFTLIKWRSSGVSIFAPLEWDASRSKSDHDGGTVFSPTVPSPDNQTGTDSEKVSAYLDGTGETDPGGVGVFVLSDQMDITPDNFGALRGGNDDLAVIQAAVNSGRKVRGYDDYRYVTPGRITISQKLDMRDIYLDFSGAGNTETCLRAILSFLPAPTLTADAAFGSNSITVDDTSNLSPGQWIKIRSDKVWGAVSGVTTGESVRISEILSATEFSVFSTLDDDYLLSDNAEILLYSDALDGTVLENVDAIGPGASANAWGAFFGRCHGVKVLNCNFTDFYRAGVDLLDVANVQIRGNDIFRCLEATTGYCLTMSNACRDVKITGNTLAVSRTGLTAGGLDGVSRDVLVEENTCYANWSAALGAKDVAAGWIVKGNICQGDENATGLGEGLRLAGRDFILEGNILSGYRRSPIQCSVSGDNGNTGLKISIKNNLIKDSIFIPILVGVNDGDTVSALSIQGNEVEMKDGATSSSNGVIHVRCDNGVIRNANLSGNTLVNSALNCIDVRTSGTGVITNLLVGGNILELSSSANAAGRQQIVTVGITNYVPGTNISAVN